MDARQGCLPEILPQSVGVSNDRMARWHDGCDDNGRPPRRVLCRLLLGVDAGSVWRGCDEYALGHVRADRENHTQPEGHENAQWYGSGLLGRVLVEPVLTHASERRDE